ncbi:hypothetical protein AMJ49_07020, partial [Parcubacteria bacterium DG_74_2]
MVDLIKKHWKTILVFGIELILIAIFITQIQNLITPVSAYGDIWIEATSTAQWSTRSNHTLVDFNNKIWVIGGPAVERDVWYSTNGVSWTQATDTAQWTARIQHTSVSFNNKIWVIGGWDSTYNNKNDVWYSTNGVSWIQATDTAQWSGRSDHTSVVFDNKIWVIGGWDGSGNCNGSGNSYCRDVWYSNNGISWTQATNTAQWIARVYHTSVVFDNKIWVIGGNASGSYKNDVWYSTNGISWIQATDTAQWSAREDHTSVVFDNKIWVIGGVQEASPYYTNDVWYSTNGVSWTQATPAAQWSARYEHTSVTYDNKIWVIGGENAGGKKNDVWYLGNPVLKEIEVSATVQAWLSFSVSPTTTPLSPDLVDTGGGLH